jgi:hypothetical protein
LCAAYSGVFLFVERNVFILRVSVDITIVVVVVLRVHDLDDVAIRTLMSAASDDDAGQDKDKKDWQEEDEENLKAKNGLRL